jgi:hypothetical protein
MKYKFLQNQRVQVNIEGSLICQGKVVGVASTGAPVIGPAYIIEPDESISSEQYPYSHFTAFELHLAPLPG